MSDKAQSPKQMIWTAVIAVLCGGGGGALMDQLSDDVDELAARVDVCCPAATPTAEATASATATAAPTAKPTATATAEAAPSAAPAD